MLAVGLAGLARSGDESGEGLERGRVGKASGSAHGGDQLRAADRAQAGQAGGQPGRIHTAQGDVPGVLVPGPFGLGGSDQAYLAGDLGGQVVQGAAALSPSHRATASAAAVRSA